MNSLIYVCVCTYVYGSVHSYVYVGLHFCVLPLINVSLLVCAPHASEAARTASATRRTPRVIFAPLRTPYAVALRVQAHAHALARRPLFQSWQPDSLLN